MKLPNRVVYSVAFFVCLLLNTLVLNAQQAMVREEKLTMNTYMYSDPSPIPQIGRLYPYFRFDGYTGKGQKKTWNMVILENDFIKVYVCPEIGGKVWGAIEKSTGKEFLYFNHSVKFRDIAMRGAWTSGGLEFNFGDIGHIPSCATPVDYKLKTNEDGSVSCVVGALDLPSRTTWNVEIRLPKDKAFFQTKSTWVNNSSLPVTYYHWMNAAAKADGNLEFLVPGNKRIGHGGELGEWPFDNKKKINFYEENDFGIYKSYHVINAYSDYFGGYYHDDNFGFGHHGSYDDKPGKKIWIWGLSDQGMIWEDLLTDADGQYIEYQAGKLFNQAAHSSTNTPFKHREFSPYDTDVMIERWFPIKETGGMVAASEYAVLNVERDSDRLKLSLSPLQDLDETLIFKSEGQELKEWPLNIKTLELFTDEIELDEGKEFELILGAFKLYYNSNPDLQTVNRPVEPNTKFNWSTAYGKYIQALELEKQRRYADALKSYLESFEQEEGFSPTLNRLSMAYYRIGNYKKALKYAELSLSIDTYDPLGNYSFGLIHTALGNKALAKSGFSISSQNTAYRSASYTELANQYLVEGNYAKTKEYADKALVFNSKNLQALEMEAIMNRKKNDIDGFTQALNKLERIDPINHLIASEKMFNGSIQTESFQGEFRSELPAESFLELAMKYHKYGCLEEAIKVLEMAPDHPMVSLWLAYLDFDNQDSHLNRAISYSSEMVFPHRIESIGMLKHLMVKSSHWKLKYYLGLIYWNQGLIEMAKDLITECGKEPEQNIFYLVKAKLFDDDKNVADEALNHALELNITDWRTNLALIERDLQEKRYDQARKRAYKFVRKYPENARFGMLYAKSLIALEAYETCIAFLTDFKVLPFEGATEGRDLYHQACIKASYKSLRKGKNAKAVKFAEKAKLWPRNLGVGKPYEVDERLDDFVLAMNLKRMGEDQKAMEALKRVAEHVMPDYLNENSKLLLQLESLRLLSKNEEALDKLETVRKSDSGNLYVKWVEAKVLNRNPGAVEKMILGQNSEVAAYDTKIMDNEFEILLEGLDIFAQDLK